jgi:tetratricopeptide (TPR) repeat protein
MTRRAGIFFPNRATRVLAAGLSLVAIASLYRFLDAQQSHKPSVSSATQKGLTPKPAAAATVQAQRNIGKAYYEQGKYPEAIAAFQQVVASGQAVAMDHLALGQALMQANQLDEALGELTTAHQMDPKLLAVEYNLGILYKREQRYPEAEAALKHVAEADPSDPATWFNLGTIYFAEKKLDEALDAHQHVVQMGFGHGENFYVASTYHMFTILTRLKQQAEAQKFLKINQELRDKVPGISLQYPALEAGKYGVLVIPTAPLTVPPQSAASESGRVTFADITGKLNIPANPGGSPPSPAAGQNIQSSDYSFDWGRDNLVPLFGPSIAIGDYDGDGYPDLYVVSPAGRNHLYHNNGDGTFTDVTDKAGVAGSGASLSATFADYDNSGHPSLFVAGLGGITLYHNDGKGTFTDVTQKAGLKDKGSEVDTRAVLFDSDNDGFVDLVVTAYTDLADSPKGKATFAFPRDFSGLTSRLYRNNGDGTFTDVTASSGLSAKGRMRKVVFADFNNDGYADLLFVRDDGPPLLYINKGEGKFADRTAEAGATLAQSSALDAEVADFNHDGNFDLALWSLSGYQVLLNQGNAKFAAAGAMPAVTPPSGIFAFRGTVADVNADGFDDLVVVDGSGKWRLIANHAGKFSAQSIELTARKTLSQLTPAWLVNPGKLDLVGVETSGEVVAFERQGPPVRWVEVRFDGFKSNKQGIGNIVEFKAGNFYKKALATGDPVRVYTGDLTKLDVVRTTWPNQVVQNSIDVATNQPVSVRESERLASSCPFLYVWDGKAYVFFTDILGVAPLGELLPDGTRMKPNPEELVRLGSKLRLQEGNYVFQVTNEMREVDYFDQLRLLAVDHPADEEVYADEIYSSSPQPPSLYAVREKRPPISAVDDRGDDVLPLIQSVDGRYPTGFSQNRILGLAEPHTLTLDLGVFPQDRPVALWLTGWVFWTDSNASRALMSNSQLQMIPPYLQVRDERGQWTTAIPDMGLPSGTNRTMTVDLTGKFPTSDHHLRIVTNFCVYWDQIFFTTNETVITTAGSLALVATVSKASSRGLSTRVGELPLVSANLHYRGFSTPVNDPKHQRPDSFDYVHVLAYAPWNPFLGNYTRYGEVGKLLARTDDRLVVMATGDEMTVKFSAQQLPPLKPGWKRDFFLYVSGYAKDGEPNTAYSRTVAPLPFRAMANYPYGTASYPDDQGQRAYLREYQTRPGHALIPPLAPAVN